MKHAAWGCKAAWPELEVYFLAWIQEKRNNGFTILPSLILLKALDLPKKEKYNIPARQFKAGKNGCQRFLKKNRLSIRQKMMLAQRLPAEDEEKIINFHSYVIKHRKQHRYPMYLIANMDETLLTFDMLPNRTINKVGEKTVKTKGNERWCQR